MALVLRTPAESEEFVSHVRQNMVRRNLPAPLTLGIRRERGLSVLEGVEIVDPFRDPVIGPSVDGGAIGQCVGAGGDWMRFVPTVVAGTTVIQVAGPIPSPFMVTQVHARSDDPGIGKVRFVIKHSADNDTTGGLFTSGVLIGRPFAVSGTNPIGADAFQVFPNFRVFERNRFLKVVVENAGPGNFIAEISISFLYL